MSRIRHIISVTLVLCLTLGLLSGVGAVQAATRPMPPTEQEAAALRTAYLQSKVGASQASGHAVDDPGQSDGAAILAGVRVPPELRSGLKDRTTLDVIITIPGAPSLAHYASSNGTSLRMLKQANAVPVVAAARQAQDQVIGKLVAVGAGLSNMQRSSVLVNVVSGTVAKGQFAALVQAVGKENVHIASIYTLDDAASNTLIGSGPTGVWTDPGVDGTGMYVGVVDTGVDYHHPDLGGSSTSTFPTGKIVAGHDFGNNDTDPMDTNGHGTHVSGIIAADGADLKGVAPKAKLVFAKIVQGGTGSASSIDIMRAFDYMADPLNLDHGVEGTHPPVASINMSFGSIAGWADATDPEQMAIQACVDNGIVVSLSAGNSNQSYSGTGQSPWYPDVATVGTPSITPGAISVASSENNWFYGPAVTESTAAADYVYIVGSTSPNPVTSLGDNTGPGYAYVYCGLGRVPADGAGYPDDFAGLALTGKIALIDRGTTSFYMKINNAAARGAVGVIVANNVAGSVSMNTTGATLTSVSVSKADGVSLKLKATVPVGDGTGRLKFLGHFAGTPNPAVDTISSFSSWGPPPDFSFKPELTAPGGGIWSTVPVAMGSYGSMSGTSMAAPHVAAVAALIMEQHPDWTPAMVKIALMNTAKLLTDPTSGQYYSPHLQGAGRINVANALHTDVTVTRDNGLPYVNLGSLLDYATVPVVFTLQLRNTGASAVTYTPNVTTQSVKEDGSAQAVSGVVVTTIPSGSITVPAGSTASLVVMLDLSGAILPSGCFPYIEGFVSLVPTPGVALHVPYTGFMGSWNDFNKDSAAYNPILDPEASDTDYNFSQVLTDNGLGLTWPFGASDSSANFSYLGEDFDGNLDMSHIGWNPAVTGQDNLLASMYVLRNAANVTIDVKDNAGNLVKQIDSYNGLWKGNYASNGLDSSWWYQNMDTGAMWWWNGRLSRGGNAPDGVYHLTYTATPFKMFNSAYADAPQVIDFPIILDTVGPVATVTSVEAGAPGMWKVNFTGSDAGSGLWGYAVYHGNPTTTTSTWAHTMVDPTATSYQIPAGEGFFVVAYDFANNVTIADQTFSDVTITTSSVPHGVVDQAYSTTITTTGGTGLYYYTLAAGALSTGLTLSSSGIISGTPVIAGSNTFTVQVTDGNSVDTQDYTLEVTGSGFVITTTSPLPTGMLGVPYYQVVSAVGGDGTHYSWSLNSGTLPPGLSLDLLTPGITSTTAALQGTPTTVGTFSFTLKIVSDGQVALKDFSLLIEQPTVLTLASPNGGESWQPGTVHDVTWTVTGKMSVVDHFSLHYSVDGDNSWEFMGFAPSAARSFSWTVPSRISSHARVIAYAMNAASELQAYDASDAFFTVVPEGTSIPVIALDHPVAESWTAGTTQEVTWSVSGALPVSFHHFSVYASLEDGRNGSWFNVGYSPTPSLSWAIPGAIGSAHAKIVVYTMDASSHLLADAEPADFVITPATGAFGITVTAPSSGTTLHVGVPTSVTWNTTGTLPPVASYKVYYSVDGGLSWESAGAIAASPFSWTVPARLSSACKVMVVATDVTGNVLGVATSSTFTIAP